MSIKKPTFTAHSIDFNKDEVLTNIFRLQDLWVLREANYPFFTLGRSAYLDGKTPEYREKQLGMNTILYNNFKELYDNVLDILQEELNEDVFLPDDLCYPGFHIFKSHEKLLHVAGHWHEDYPHEILELGDKDASTFTVAIMVPESGAGMDYMIDNMPIHIGYKEKEMIWHDGKTLHRIAGFKEYVPNEYRITLQGHLIRRNNHMEVFW